MSKELSEQELVRRENLEKIKSLGIDPYPSSLFSINTSSSILKKTYKDGDEKEITIAGRIMTKRIMGKASFVELQDSEGKIQIYINRDLICDEDKTDYNVLFKKLLDIGDFLGVSGVSFKTKVGEISIKAKKNNFIIKIT